MAVAFDVATESHTGTTGSTSQASFSWSHTAGGSARAVVVFVFSILGSDNGSSVTYGGVSMSAVAGGSASDTVTEPGTCKAYFLDNCGTGTKTVVVSRTNNATIMYADAISVTAAGATETHGVVLLQENQSPAQASVDDGSPGTDSLRVAGGYYGSAGPPAAGSSSTRPSTAFIDLTSYGCAAVYETTAGQGARNIGFTNATSDDFAAVHFAIREVANPDVNAPAGAAAGTGSAAAAAPKEAVPATAGSGTGTAANATVSDGVHAQEASGSGTAAQPSVKSAFPAGAASGTGTAADPTVVAGVNVDAGVASAAGAAADASVAIAASAGAASGVGTAADAALSLAVPAEAAAGVGAAADATVDTSSLLNVSAEPAFGTASAADAVPGFEINSEASNGVGTAPDATVTAQSDVSANAEAATGTGAAAGANAAIGANATAAAAIAMAMDPSLAVAVGADAAHGIGTAVDASGPSGSVIQTGHSRLGPIYAQQTIPAAAPSIFVVARAAGGSGEAGNPNVIAINYADDDSVLELLL